MSRETAASIISALQPLIAALLAAAAAWITAAIRRKTANARAAEAVAALSSGAAKVVSEINAEVVADLKDPNKPGTWNQVAAAAARAAAEARLRGRFPADVSSLEGVLGTEPVKGLLGALVEAAVSAAKQTAR